MRGERERERERERKRKKETDGTRKVFFRYRGISKGILGSKDATFFDKVGKEDALHIGYVILQPAFTYKVNIFRK